MRGLGVFAVLVCAVVVAGCGGGSDGGTTARPVATAVSPASLVGTPLQSTAVTGFDLAPGTHVSIEFGADDTVGFSAGCNRFHASYRVDGGVLKLATAPASTSMACDQALEQQDGWLANVLAAGVRLTPAGAGHYVLTSPDGTTTIRLSPAPAAAGTPTLRGVTWVLQSTAARGADAVPGPADVLAPTLRFEPGGKLELSTGCNAGAGHYTEADGFITVARVATTRRACTDRQAAALEHQVLGMLDGKVAHAWSGEGDLVLARDGAHLTYRAE